MKYLKYLSESLDELRKKWIEEIEAEQIENNKRLEEKFPELLKISEEIIKFEEDSMKKMDKDIADKFTSFTDELTNTEGFKEAMGVLRKIITEIGVVKSLKMIKISLSTMKGMIQYEKKVRDILPKGEKYDLPLVGVITGGDDSSGAEKTIDRIKDALTVKNLMKVLTGDTDELELKYNKKEGGEATGKIKDVEVKDDGSIEVSIKNDKVGTIKKDITEITAAGDAVEKESDDNLVEELPKKLAEIKSKKPGDIKRISNFVDFISNDMNKENTDKIYKIMGL